MKTRMVDMNRPGIHSFRITVLTRHLHRWSNKSILFQVWSAMQYHSIYSYDTCAPSITKVPGHRGDWLGVSVNKHEPIGTRIEVDMIESLLVVR